MRLEWSAVALADRFAFFLQDRHPRLANRVAREILANRVTGNRIVMMRVFHGREKRDVE